MFQKRSSPRPREGPSQALSQSSSGAACSSVMGEGDFLQGPAAEGVRAPSREEMAQGARGLLTLPRITLFQDCFDQPSLRASEEITDRQTRSHLPLGPAPGSQTRTQSSSFFQKAHCPKWKARHWYIILTHHTESPLPRPLQASIAPEPFLGEGGQSPLTICNG